MAEIKIQDIQAQIQKFRKENPQKVKGLNDEQVVSIMVQQGAMPKETAAKLSQILSGEFVRTEGSVLGKKSYTITGKDKNGNLKSDIYIDFNGDNVADLKIFRQGSNVSIFASQQSNGQITGWTTTKDYDEYKSAVLDTVEINNAEKKQKAEKTKPSAETKKTEEPKPAEDTTKPEETNNDPVSTGKEEPAKTPEDKEKEKLAKKEANIKEHLIQIFRDPELKELFLSVSPDVQNTLLNKDPKTLGITKSGIPSNKYKKEVKAFLEDNCKDNNEIRNAYLTSCDREDLAKFFLKPLAEQEKLLNSDNIMQSFAPQKVVNPQAEAAKLERLKRNFLSNADEKTKEYFKQLDSEGQRLFLYAYEHDFNHQTFKDARSFKEVVLNDFLERHKVSQEELEERKAANNVKRQRRDFVSTADKETLQFFKQLSAEGQKVFLEAYENGTSDEIVKNKSEFLEKYKASDETIQHRKQESTFRGMLITIDSLKTAKECQIFIDRINEQYKDKIDKYKYVLDAAQTKMSSFPPEEIAKAQDPAWREEMRISREMNHLTARTLFDRQLKASVDLDRQRRQMGWADWTGQAILDLFGESDIEEAYANYDAFREKVSRLYAVQYTMTREEFGKEVEKIMGQGKYDHKLVEKIQRNHPEYLQLTSAKNTVDALNDLAEKKYSEESVREIEQVFGGIDKIKEYMPNYEEYSDETKFVKLKQLVDSSASTAKAQLEQMLNGRTYDDVIKAHEADYEKYLKMIGVKDIEQKMQEYREDVASAAGWVKCAVTVAGTIALTVATGGAGGVLAAGLIATGTSAAVEVSNRATNDVADLSSWSDWGEIGQSAAIDGLSTALGMKVGGKILASTLGKYAKFGASVASDTAIGAAAELAQTGQVTWKGTLMGAAFAGAGNGLAVYVAGKGMRKYTPNKDLPVYKPPTDGQIAIVNTNEPSVAIKILENSNIKNSTGTLSVLNPQNTKELTNNQVLILNMVVNLKDKSRISMELVDKLLANGDPRFADACLSRNLDFANLPPEKHATLVELHTAVDKQGYPKYGQLSTEDILAYDPKKAKLFDKAYSITRTFGQDTSSIQKAMSKPQRVDAIIEFFEKNKDYIKNQEQIDFLFSCTDAEFKDAIKQMKQTALHNRLVINSNSGVPDISNFPNLSKIEPPKTVNDLLNNKSLTDIEKAVLEETYEHLCDLGFKDKIDADPALLLNLSKNKYNLGVDATKLSKADIETMLYAREQYKKGLISEAEQNQVLRRMNMGTPAELFKYIDTPENLIPETITIKRSWGKNTYTKEQIIQWTKGDRVLRKLLDRQSTPADLTVHRVDDAAVHKNIKIGDKSLESLLAEGKSPEEIVKLINNSTSSSMQFDNFIGTSLGGVTGFTNKHSVRWEIDVPKGSKGAHLDSLVHLAEYMGENEFLLQAGTTLRIKGAKYENGQFVLKAEAVQDGKIKTTQIEPTITPEQPNVAPKSSTPLGAEPTTAPTTKKTTFTDEQINKIIEDNNILGFNKPLLERLATHAPETLENILKRKDAKNILNSTLLELRNISDDELKKLNGKLPVAKDIKDLAYLSPDLQDEYMRLRLIKAESLHYRLMFSGEKTSIQLLNKIKNLSDEELINLDKTLKVSTNPVELKKAMEKLGISSDDIPLNNNKELSTNDRLLLSDIIYSGCDFSTTEINNLLHKGKFENVKIAIGQKVAQDISLSKEIINNGKEITLQQAERINELSLTGKKYTTDEINKIINAPEKDYKELINLYSNKPESYYLSLGEELRIDSQNTIIAIKGQNGYYPLNFQDEAVQEFVKKLKEGEVYHVLNKDINPNDTSLPYELCLIKKENGQIIIQNSFSDGLVINPTMGKELKNISKNNNIIPDPTDQMFLRKECKNNVEKQFVLAKLLGNPELKNVDSQLIYDMYDLNCTGKLYEKIRNKEKITKQTLLDLKQEALLNKIKNTDDRTIMQELLNSQTINPEMVSKIMHSENEIFNKIKTEILAGKKITPEVLDNIASETILEQIKQGKNKFSISDKKIVDTILNSPYAKDFTPIELLNILNDDKYRGIALGKIRDGQPITKDLFPNCNKKITTSSLLDIANREIHKQTNINNRQFGKGYPEIKQSIIETYYKNPQKYQEKLNKIIPAGEIRKSPDGTLYYNSGNELIKIGLDENTFKDIFPSSMNHRINQGSIGDCWLISTFGALMDTPVGRGQIYKLFSQQGDTISIKLPDAQTPIQFKREKIGDIKIKDKQGNIKIIPNYSYKMLSAKNIKTDGSININHGNLYKNPAEKNLNSSIGLRMLEAACADLRADKLFNGSKMGFTPEEIITTFGADAVTKSLTGGFNIDAINMICGYKNNRIIEELNLRNKNIDEQIKILEKHVNNPNTIITFWTRGTNDSFHWNKELDIIKQHAYRILGVNKAKQTITISNPHHNNKTIEIPFSEFLQYAAKCQILNIT